MKFYTQQHPHYCGIDLHARTTYLCILNQEGVIVLHRNMKTEPEALLKAIAPFREFIAIVVECNFYWVADPREGIAFVLGHALYMKAIHGGKAKSHKILQNGASLENWSVCAAYLLCLLLAGVDNFTSIPRRCSTLHLRLTIFNPDSIVRLFGRVTP